MQNLHFFLGANSAGGFYSLYDGLLGGRFDDLMILKGGPGCGKSTFMRRLAAAEEARGGRVVYIHCSGDPASLDGAVFPDRGAAVVDGTPPHALEPTYALACERCVDLTRCCDAAAAKSCRAEIVSLSDAYRAHYRDAYRALRAANGVAGERRALLRSHLDGEKLFHRVESILFRALRGTGEGSGRAERVFLGGVTHLGDVCRFDTVDALCPRVYALCDDAGLASQSLARLGEAVCSRGLDILLCPNPDRPEETQHLLIPALGLAFVTANARIPYPGRAHRRLHPDAMAAGQLSRGEKARLRFLARVEKELRGEAVVSLARAKAAHDELESAYRPCVDFSAVSALADEEAARMAS